MTSSAASFPRERHAGVLLPLFSAASDEGWGIGEIPDLVTLAAWHRRAGLDFLLMLPVNELAPSGHHSPYATVSAMAIDPIYLRLADVPEFVAAGGVERLSADQRDRLAAVRQSTQVDYDAVREVKEAALHVAFDRFEHERSRRHMARVAEFASFMQREADWLDDYVLFRALRDRFASQPWWEWPDGLSTRQPSALARRAAKPQARDPLPRLPAVARRRAVAGGAGGGGDPLLRRSAVRRRRRQRRRLAAPGELRLRAVRRHAARRVQRRGPGLGPAGLPLGLRRARRLRLAPRPGASRHRALRRLSRRSRDRLLPHLRARRGRCRPLHARGSGGAEGPRAEDHAGLPGTPVRPSSPRIWAPCRTSSASR